MIRVADYIVKRLVDYGVCDVFMISGGGAMHLNDAFGYNTDINYICNHHEQASAMAAEGYARVSGKLAVVCVTTGPGGLNALNGVFGQWTDSVSVLYISGQVKRETTIAAEPKLNLRQLGDQEADIVQIVKPITKYACSVFDPHDIRYVLEKAMHVATSGRRGPVWIDIPLDVQGSVVDETSLNGYTTELINETKCQPILFSQMDRALNILKQARRPVLVVGHGVRLAGAQSELIALLDRLRIPVLTSLNGCDLIPYDHPFFCGRIGTIGQRAGNFVLQNADTVVFLGTRNNIRQVGYHWKDYVKTSKKIVVDIDSAELEKPTLVPDVAMCCDAKEFVCLLSERFDGDPAIWEEWLKWGIATKEKFWPTQFEKYKQDGGLSPYLFLDQLCGHLKDDSVVVTGNGSALVALFQVGKNRSAQRYIWNSGCASMGYGLPAAIGACVGKGTSDVICITGDGSIMMNLQELQTIRHYNLPIKIFVLNNNGYISIRQTQSNFFGRFSASTAETGVSLPDFLAVAGSFKIPAMRVTYEMGETGIDRCILDVINARGPFLCDVLLSPHYAFQPKSSSEKLSDGRIISKPLEDMHPFLSRDEFEKAQFSQKGRNVFD